MPLAKIISEAGVLSSITARTHMYLLIFINKFFLSISLTWNHFWKSEEKPKENLIFLENWKQFLLPLFFCQIIIIITMGAHLKGLINWEFLYKRIQRPQTKCKKIYLCHRTKLIK